MNASAVGMAQFTEVGSKTKKHPDTLDSLELVHREAVGLKAYFHNDLIVVAKFGLSIRWCMVNGSVYFIKVCYQEMVVATFNILKGSPMMFQNGIRQARLILGPC